MERLKILVIDDDFGIESTFESIGRATKKKHDINLEIKLANTKDELNEILSDDSQIYDLVFVDYFLEKSFGEQTGIEIIAKIRSQNRLCKIIFFSSHIESIGHIIKNGIKTFKIENYIEFINKYNVDKILSKTNIGKIVEVIAEASKGINLLSITLQRMIKDYEDISEALYFNSVTGKRIEAKDLIKELNKNTNIGKEFEETYHKTLLNMVLDSDL